MKRVAWLFILLLLPSVNYAVDTDRIYQQHCASCHNADRLGAMGPALLPENLGRLKKAEASSVIANGRAATQMPAFAEKLSKEEIDALVTYI